MNGMHDLGGMDNFGPVVREPNEPVFHADWESAVAAHTYAMGVAGYFIVDESRRAVEWMAPADYLTSSYYEKWLYALETLLLEKDVLTKEELDTGKSLREEGGFTLPPLSVETARLAMANGIPLRLDLDISPRFKPGDRIFARNINPTHHTRLPRYIRGKRGVIEQDHGVFPFPDTVAHGEPDRPQHVYSVRFGARELWGDDAPAKDSIHIDLFDDYMDPLDQAQESD